VTGRKILVVDDNAHAVRLLELLLAAQGHTTHTALDGASAVAAARSFVPDLVLLDLSLPDFDGFEVAHRLHAIPELARVEIVALTGWSDPELAARARRSGFAELLVKPVDLDTLDRLLARR
jgi:CheY-like chemotaxis protein